MKKIILLFFIISSCSYASILYKPDDGIKLYNLGQYDNAVEYFNSYIKSNPNDEDGYFWLGKSYDKLNNDKKALIAFKHAYALAQNNKNIDKIDFEDNEYNNLEDYFDMAFSYWEEGNYKEAINYADMMLKIDPDCSSAYFLKSKILYTKNDKTTALDLLNKAILLDNTLLNTKLAKNLGVNKLPELSPQDCALYASKYYFKGDINSSIKYLKQYLENDKENIDIYVSLIDCYLKNHNPEEAKNVLVQAKKISQNNLSLIIAEADIAYFDKSSNFEDLLLKAYNINPNNKKTLLNLGNYYLENEKYESAKQYFETLVNIDDKFYEGYFGYLYSLIKINDLEGAQNQIRKLTAFNQNNGETEYLLAMLCEANEDYKEAINYLNSAVKISKSPMYLLALGKLNYICGNCENSIKFLTLAGDNKEAKEYLTLNYLKLNNISKAREVLGDRQVLDKNRIMYKYNLYKIYKSENNIGLNQILKQKPVSVDDYVDIIRINLFENKPDSARKNLKNAFKKYDSNQKLKYVKREIENFQYSPIR